MNPQHAEALKTIMRMADAAKEPCGMDPESPAAIRNSKLASIAQVAAQGLGLVRGPTLAALASAPYATPEQSSTVAESAEQRAVAGSPIGYLPSYELDRLESGHDGRLRSAKFGPSALDGDVPVYIAPLAAAPAAQQAAPSIDDLRAQGWSVAVHNDYRQYGTFHTFWLLTKGDRCVKGEGCSDAEALAEIARALAAHHKEQAP